jgi:hypothetical protein
MDNFVIAVLVGAAVVILVFGVMMLLDKGKPAPAASAAVSAPEKVGKR